MDAIKAVRTGLIIVGFILMITGWFLVVQKSKEDSPLSLLGILFPLLPAWVISAVHYRDQKRAFWIQTTGAFLITGGGSLHLAVH